jgi:hypothetical protein
MSKPLTKKQGLFLIAHCDGLPPAAAAKAAGMSPRNARRLLAKADFRALVRMRAREIISDAAPRAAKRLDELMTQNESKHVAKDAAIALLGIEGIRPPAGPAAGPLVNLNFTAGFTLRTDEEARQFDEHVKKHGEPPGPGYVIRLGGAGSKAPLIEHGPQEIESAQS